ncbi:hypothetical protein MRX96_016445 [Rhipicephalus microplus]
MVLAEDVTLPGIDHFGDAGGRRDVLVRLLVVPLQHAVVDEVAHGDAGARATTITRRPSRTISNTGWWTFGCRSEYSTTLVAAGGASEQEGALTRGGSASDTMYAPKIFVFWITASDPRESRCN